MTRNLPHWWPAPRTRCGFSAVQHLLHILTRTEDALAQEVIREQTALRELELDVADLTTSTPDYDLLLKRILAADAVVVW